MNEQPLVSIITPSYNAENYIEETIKTVLNQSYTNWEMIICDDCSRDRTVEIVEQYAKQDPRVKLIKLTENSGAAVTRNTAINNSSGRFIAFLDADDQWVPDKLTRQISFMLEKDVGFSFTGYEVMDDLGKSTEKVVQVPEKVNYQYLLKNTIIGCLTVVLDREKVGEVQMPLYRTRQDFALWLSILKKGHIAYGLNEVLARYRKTAGSISRNKVKAAKQNWIIYRKHEKLSLLPALWYFVNYAWNGYMKNRD
ncbi:glycosyltransferase family 2 protein [Mesobacillus jeotgali]|uniref:Glycosyltransferase family 2 protein n=1 Tax=Mesobacillus jeotgali TaxID=129985 RepID=A0ABY9VHN2_9BACI|nr:glycosyltransferase family 2 protein [Mesobacillus jeotgali]WNF22649.1 glycosyltransferase family 2 protein [Mesobacillus jeotgali]